jgi:hypothetical protein
MAIVRIEGPKADSEVFRLKGNEARYPRNIITIHSTSDHIIYLAGSIVASIIILRRFYGRISNYTYYL